VRSVAVLEAPVIVVGQPISDSVGADRASDPVGGSGLVHVKGRIRGNVSDYLNAG